MTLSWNEIKQRAIKFSKDWETATKENASSQPFWIDFFEVFGISQRRVSSFEYAVKKTENKSGRIDLFWKGTLLIEHKSKGKDLDKAFQQAMDYLPALKEDELPKYILVADFERFSLYDIEEKIQHEFVLSELYKNINLFGFIAGYQKLIIREEDPINLKAAQKMSKLHDLLKENGYEGHQLQVYLVRLLFMLFADDTAIFDKDIFWHFVEQHTKEDGSDLAIKIAEIFQVLNTPKVKRQQHLDEIYKQFPYVNGKLFEENLLLAAFDSKMRQILLDACALDWSLISPAIFGSLFQSIMDKKERRNLGAHYTSEKNILKLIKPLFLDQLWKDFEKAKDSSRKLAQFHRNLGKLKFFDPACGSGNFLIIAYRELRLLELAILQEIYKNQQVTNISQAIWIDIDQFYGIEIDEWATRIAEVAMWLVDHQMNMMISEKFGKYFVRIPLKKTVNITYGNSLQIDWQSIVPKKEIDYIFGNPPFIGKYLQTKQQKEDLKLVTGGLKGAGTLDYVSMWFLKAADYIQKTKIKVAFVSTNSISQGEQVGVLWGEMFRKFKIKIHFAHRTFKWTNEAKGKAAVHVVIIGFANFDIQNKILFDYEDIKGEASEAKVKNINPYLIETADLIVTRRCNSISNAKNISFGSMPNDGGNLLLSDEEKNVFLEKEPQAEKYIKPLLSAREFLNGKKRWCLWLKDVTALELRNLKEVNKRVELVKKYRTKSSRPTTRNLANFPTLFGEIRQSKTDFLLIPRVSSARRKYIPMAFFTPDFIASDTCLTIPDADFYDFGMLSSLMHTAWVKYAGGKLKSDYRYSNKIVYNNYPFPKNLTKKQKDNVSVAAEQVLKVRKEFPESSLADLYDPLAMPPKLTKAHQKLDKAVDLCYRRQKFVNERGRIEFLFDLYSQYMSPIMAEIERQKKVTKRRGRRKL